MHAVYHAPRKLNRPTDTTDERYEDKKHVKAGSYVVIYVDSAIGASCMAWCIRSRLVTLPGPVHFPRPDDKAENTGLTLLFGSVFGGF